MYSKEQAQKLQQLTSSFLKKAPGKSEIEKLRDVLRFHEYRYYVMNDPLIADYEYDTLYKVLEHIEKENPQLIKPDSPTQRVARGLIKDFPKVQHLVPML